MNWERYRQLCDQGDVLSRWMLERTALLLEDADEGALADILRETLAAAPLPKPPDHRAGAATDFFRVDLDPAAARTVRETIAAAAARGAQTPEGRGLGGFVEAWQEYLDWITGRHPRSPHRDANGGG